MIWEKVWDRSAFCIDFLLPRFNFWSYSTFCDLGEFLKYLGQLFKICMVLFKICWRFFAIWVYFLWAWLVALFRYGRSIFKIGGAFLIKAPLLEIDSTCRLRFFIFCSRTFKRSRWFFQRSRFHSSTFIFSPTSY